MYTDKDSGGNAFHFGFQSMIFDCYENLIDIVLVKSISRLARNTVDLLETVNKLRSMGIKMMFHQENIRTSEVDNDVLVAVLTAIAQAEVVRKVLDLYLSGLSIGLIIRELELRNIKTPQGKDGWSKRAIQTILTNEKYIGNVILGKTYTADFPNNNQCVNRDNQEQYLMKNVHEPIIEVEKFELVQKEIKRRSNIEFVNGRVKGKGTHYSSKRKKRD